jgi:hypothetical protein
VNLYKSRSPEKSGNISREDINFYRSLKEKTDEAYNILSSFHQGVLKKIVSHPNYNTLSGHTKEMVQKYQEKVGQIVDILRDVPVEAFTIENTEDLPRKVEGEKLLLSVLNYMRDNNQFSINDFSSMIKSFSEIPQYKDVIDINYYPTKETKTSNMRHRPTGLGVQGLGDLFLKLKLPFDSEESRQINKNIFTINLWFYIKFSIISVT